MRVYVTWDLPLVSSLGVWVFPAVRPSQRSGWEKSLTKEPVKEPVKEPSRLRSATFTTPPGVHQIAWAATATTWSRILRPFLGRFWGLQRTAVSGFYKGSERALKGIRVP